MTSRRVIPDPAKAIESALPAIFAEANDLPVEQFLTRLAAIFPVFETGAIRQDFDAMRLTPLADADKRLSIATKPGASAARRSPAPVDDQRRRRGIAHASTSGRARNGSAASRWRDAA